MGSNTTGISYTPADNTGGGSNNSNFGDVAENYYQQAETEAIYNQNKYDHTDTNTYKVEDFNNSNMNMKNPYQQVVITGGKASTSYDIVHGTPTNFVDHFDLIYGTNTGYTTFEHIIFNAQKKDYTSKYNTALQNSLTKTTTSAQVKDLNNYSNNRFGGELVNSLTNDLVTLENQVFSESYSDKHTPEYNRIKNTSSSVMQAQQTKDIADIKAQLIHAKNIYDNKEFQTKLAELQKKEKDKSQSNWIFDIQYIPPTFPPFIPQPRQDINGFSQLFLSGDINSWMAGGDLYDAPRAGDVMFNVIGNMNTVRFLGLEDTNKFPDIVQEFVNPEVYRSLGAMAGDKNFSVIPPTLYT